MITAALAVTETFGANPPHALVAGDIGTGNGTRDMFHYLTEQIDNIRPDLITLHYCLPVMALVKKLYQAIENRRLHPVLIADAGGMYAAKAAGLSRYFDVFTPDPSEMSFLADPAATHPAYLSNHLLGGTIDTPELIALAYKHCNAAKMLVVKGKTDYVATDGRVVGIINEPNIPALEQVGGTGDTITGMVSGLIGIGFEPVRAAFIAAKTNREAGLEAKVTPATPILEIINHFPSILEHYRYSEILPTAENAMAMSEAKRTPAVR
jgi:NAD(P)H-hydrate repair Nnr-like enzyme with NAD(P)H-hydrate dehydratase domain